MGLEKEVMHVVIKLPFKRPPDFVEPPPVVWTDDMEHQLWKYMNQKHTDWNYIAEQLGVPTPYLVRHAAFMYETQLRGIQQQLRLSEAGRPTTISSSPPPAVSTSSSTSNTYRSSRPPSQRQARPVSSSSTSSRAQQQQRNSTVWKDAQEQVDDEPAMAMATPTTAVARPSTSTSVAATGPTNSTSTRTSPTLRQENERLLTTTQRSTMSSSMDIEATAMATAPLDRYQHSTHDDSMMLSTISNISPRNNHSSNNNNTNDADLEPLSPHDDHFNYSSGQQQNALYQSRVTSMINHVNDRSIQKEVDRESNNLETTYHESPDNQNEEHGSHRGDMKSTAINRDSLTHGSSNTSSSSNNDDDNDDGFSKHFENMKLQLEEPAFLPSRRMEGSQLLSSLRASSYQSRSTLSSPALGTPTSSSTNSPNTPSSQPYSSAIATSALAPSSSSQQQLLPRELENTSTASEQNAIHDDGADIGGQTLSEDYSNENKVTNSNNDDASDTSSNGKAKMIFGPNLSRAATTQPSDESSNKDASSALNSVGSSFSDLSDYSVTQSAMEDAFLSKLNNGSKMSSLAFSRKYT